jgi:hypothetical protein
MAVECSFGGVVTKFHRLGKAIETSVENAIQVVKATTLLHNVIGDFKSLRELDLHKKTAVTAN